MGIVEGLKGYFMPTDREIEDELHRGALKWRLRERGVPIPDIHAGGMPEVPIARMSPDFLELMDVRTTIPPEEAERILYEEEGLM